MNDSNDISANPESCKEQARKNLELAKKEEASWGKIKIVSDNGKTVRYVGIERKDTA